MCGIGLKCARETRRSNHAAFPRQIGLKRKSGLREGTYKVTWMSLAQQKDKSAHHQQNHTLTETKCVHWPFSPSSWPVWPLLPRPKKMPTAHWRLWTNLDAIDTDMRSAWMYDDPVCIFCHSTRTSLTFVLFIEMPRPTTPPSRVPRGRPSSNCDPMTFND